MPVTSALFTGAPSVVTFGASSVASASVTVTVPAGTTRMVVCPHFHGAALVTVSTLKFNTVSLSSIAGTRDTNTNNGGDSTEAWQLVSPAIGAHTLAITMSASTRGGVTCFFYANDTGIGQVAISNGTGVVQMPAGMLDSSYSLFAQLVQSDSAVVFGTPPWQNSVTKLGIGGTNTWGLGGGFRGNPSPMSMYGVPRDSTMNTITACCVEVLS